jgi:hypothetical protein
MDISVNTLTLVTLVLVILYIFYIYITVSRNQQIKGLTPLVNVSSIAAEKLTKPTSINVYYECWVYFGAWPGAGATLFDREFNVALTATKGRLTITDKASTANSIFAAQTIDDIPMTKWVFLAFAVNSTTKTGDIYVNGKLVKSFPMKTVMTSTNNNLTIGHSTLANSYVTKFKRVPEALTADQVWADYLVGNGAYDGALFGLMDTIGNRDVQLSVYKDHVLTKRASLFGSSVPVTPQPVTATPGL